MRGSFDDDTDDNCWMQKDINNRSSSSLQVLPTGSTGKFETKPATPPPLTTCHPTSTCLLPNPRQGIEQRNRRKEGPSSSKVLHSSTHADRVQSREYAVIKVGLVASSMCSLWSPWWWCRTPLLSSATRALPRRRSRPTRPSAASRQLRSCGATNAMRLSRRRLVWCCLSTRECGCSVSRARRSRRASSCHSRRSHRATRR